MENELLEATTRSHHNKLEKYLKRRAIIKEYSEACLGDLAPYLESVELEKATLTLTLMGIILPQTSLKRKSHNKKMGALLRIPQ
ncbi:hypothetical protein VN0271_00860 [Helicobacter pylori]|nr:hypothetical protein VN0271_00860 [Helicobacter pylori]